MKFIPLMFALSFNLGTAVAFTQYRIVESDSARMISPASRSTLSVKVVNSYEYCDTINVIMENERETLKMRMPPPVDEDMTKYQVEFRELLEGILYTDKEIKTILNPRSRAILEGIAASYYEPAVYRAFEVLYEDYIPLRIAGRVVYRELRKVMDESIEYQQSQINTTIKATGMPRSDVEECWSTFKQIVSSRMLSLSDLENYMGQHKLKLIFDSSRVSIVTDTEEKGTISFENLLICLHEHNMKFGDDNSYTGNLLEQAIKLNDAVGRQQSGEHILNPKREKYNQKYDDMLVQFAKWKPLIPSGEGRRLQILKGCFVGSENPAVVEALRIIYVDYAALRLSGDWIFKVVSALMGPIERRHKRRQKKLLQ